MDVNHPKSGLPHLPHNASEDIGDIGDDDEEEIEETPLVVTRTRLSH